MDGVVKVAENVEDVRTFCLSQKVRARRKVRGPEVPGWPEVPVVAKLARTENWGSWIWAEKLEEKPKSEGENKKISGK